MISIQHEGKLTVATVMGEFKIADYRQFEDEVGAQLKRVGKINLLIDLRGMLDYTLDVALEDIRFARDMGRIAIISEQEMVAWVALLTDLFVDTEIQVFDDEAMAREWLDESAA
jgi:hypothetical protein